MTTEIEADEETGYSVTKTFVKCWISGEPVRNTPQFEASRTYARADPADRLRALTECYREVKSAAVAERRRLGQL